MSRSLLLFVRQPEARTKPRAQLAMGVAQLTLARAGRAGDGGGSAGDGGELLTTLLFEDTWVLPELS